MKGLIKSLFFLTVLVAAGPLLIFIPNSEKHAIKLPKEITAAEVETLNENSVMRMMSMNGSLSSEQRMMLTNRLANIYKTERQGSLDEIKESCKSCNDGLQTVSKLLGDAQVENDKITKAAISKAKWIFSITFLGSLVLLFFKWREFRFEDVKEKKMGAILTLLAEWIFPFIVLIISNPWNP